MTVVVAAKYKNKIIVAADSKVTRDDIRIPNLGSFSKIIRFNGFIVGFAGNCHVYTALKFIAERPAMKSYTISCQRDVVNFTKKVVNEIKIMTGSKEYGIDELMIVTEDKIYTIDSYFFIQETDKYAAIGSGGACANAILEALYSLGVTSDKQLKQYAESAVAVLCKLDPTCGFPIHFMEI